MNAIRKSSYRLGIIVTLAAAAAFSGCSKTSFKSISDTFGFGSDFHPIFSTRPQTATDSVILLKLKEAPLLTSTKIEGGKKVVDKEAAEAVKTEQDDIIAKLKALSPKIQVLYRYRLVINGLAIVAPIDQLPALRKLANVAYVETQTSFTRPVITATTPAAVAQAIGHTSVQFIGAADVQAKGIRGQGVRVGIIDTGIDYTHAMFGGAGTEAAYKAIDPAKDSSVFPTAKVIGGIDLVGTAYDSDSADFSKRTPIVDNNPLDEAGHGSHVAGTVAGHGDGTNTYDGVAPDALLYAIKVFGAEGSTGDAVVVAGLEFAANPKGDLQIEDKLDVVNLSLGSSYGNAHILYTEAMQNLSRAGTVVVASAGNSGDEDYIVGAPSVADDAISVAASVDDMDQNWKFNAVRFTTVDEPSILVEAIESTIGKPLTDIGEVTGPLVFIGLADQELTPAQKAAVAGKVALIDRGVVTFAVKIQRAFEAGAIGVVVANNAAGEAFAMGGEGKFDIPAIMITKDFGAKVKAEMAKGDVTIAFKTPDKIEKAELVDTITGFSSKGPRSNDALLKPEISAPGSLIISAKMGGGAAGVQMSGTSMAAPHMTGVMALLKQAQPTLSSAELKSLAMSTSKTLVDEKKVVYPLSRQGAGRVQALRAVEGKVVSMPQAVSLGLVNLVTRKQMRRDVTFKNITANPQTFDLVFEANSGLTMQGPSSLTLAAGETKVLNFSFTVDTTALTQSSTELDGLLKLNQAGVETSRVPVLAIANKVSQLEVSSFVVHSTSYIDSQGAAVDLTIKNSGVNAGEAYLFNLLGKGARKEDTFHSPYQERGCDLQAAGYRVIQKAGVPTLQFAAKIYEPLTTWDNCEVSVLIDSDGDGVADQELVGTKQDHLKGLTASTFASILLDASKARDLRKKFELATANPTKNEQGKIVAAVENYADAVVALSDMLAPRDSTVAIIEAPIANLRLRGSGDLAVRLATSYQELSAVEADDFLDKNSTAWAKVNVSEQGAGFANMPEKIALGAGEETIASFVKGAGLEKLLVLSPMNAPVIGGLQNDQQSMILTPRYEVLH